MGEESKYQRDLERYIRSAERPFYGERVSRVGSEWWQSDEDPLLTLDEVHSLTGKPAPAIIEWSSDDGHAFPSPAEQDDSGDGLWLTSEISDWAHKVYCRNLQSAMRDFKDDGPRRRAESMAGQTALYRHYRANGDLLYVGISLSVTQRLSEHRRHAAWFQQIAAVTVQWFHDREKAEAAEIAAIRDESPIFNKLHARQI